jgi:hypothetical protein
MVYSFKQRLVLFKGQGLLNFMWIYIKSFPIPRKGKISNMEIQIKGGPFLTGEIIDAKRPNKENIDDVIDYFDREIKYLTEKLQKSEIKLNNELHLAKVSIEDLRSNFSGQINKTRKIIEDSSISNMWLDLFGIFNIIIGLICATIPDLVCKII